METVDCPKCNHEHEPCGMHEEDSGVWECEECGFEFNVEIEYDPSYYVQCVKHEFSDPEDRNGTMCQFCVHCGKCELFQPLE